MISINNLVSRIALSTAALVYLSAAYASDVTLVARGATWKYLDNNTDQGTSWKEATFDDSTWAAGPAPLGFGDPHIVTTVDGGPVNGRYITTYFRRSFTVVNPSAITALAINLLRDDGAAIYLNGIEIARDNLPAGAINYQTIAPVIVSNADETTYFPLTPSSLPLVAGVNVLAVEIHQRDNTSSDLGFDMDLIATVPNPSNVAPTVALTAPANNAAITGTTVNLAATAADSDGTVTKVEFFQGTTKLGESPTSPYTYSWTSVAPGTYSLTAKATDSDGATTTSSAVAITVSAPPSFSYTQNFNGLPSTGTSVTFGNAATNTVGWTFVGSIGSANSNWTTSIPSSGTISAATPGTPSTTLIVSSATNVSSNTQGYDFPNTSTTDRALGTSPTIGAGVVLQLTLTNTSGSSITGLNVGYDIVRRQVVATANELPGYWLFYSLDNGVTYTNVSALNPVISGSAPAVVVPNTIGVTTVPNTAVTLSSPWTAGAAIRFRWIDDNAVATSPDQIHALDNVSITATQFGGVPPTVALTAPVTGATYSAPAAINLTATAADSDGTISKVEFYNGATKLGESTAAPYTYSWTGVPIGTYSLTAKAIDNDSNVTTSAAVSVTVNVLVIGNPPTVAITSPGSNATFTSPATINIATNAADSDGTISKVEFYNGATKLGETIAAPFNYAWSGVVPGTYSLTAKATDNDNNVTTSSAVTVVVNAPPSSGTLTRSPYLNMANDTSIVVRWRSSLSIVGRVKYGTSPTALNQTQDESVARTDHDVRLSGLTPYTQYYYSVGSAVDTLTPEAADTTSVRTAAFTNYPAPTAADYTFRTSPVAGTVKSSRIWIVGDCGRGSTSQASGRDAYYNFMGNRIPDLCLQLGDNAYNSGLDSEYQSGYYLMYPTIFRKMPQWSCLGNHDANNGDSDPTKNWPYFDMFTFPTNGECGGVASGTEHYYSFDYSNIHFICFDSQTTLANSSATAPQTVWLKNDLASTTQTWIIVFYHHPAYTKGSHDSDSESQLITMRQVYGPIFEAGGVDLVFTGHSHDYERSYLLDGHYGNANTLTAAMRKNGGNGSTTGFTTSATGTIRRAPNFAAVANVAGTFIPPDGAYIKPLTGPRENFGTVYNTAGMSGQADAAVGLNHQAMYVSYQQVGTVNLDVNGNSLTCSFVQAGGTVPDNFTVIKQGAADHDGDGIPDEYEIARGLNRFSAADAALDSDGDGLTNKQEYDAGTNPNDANDKPKLATVVAQADGSIVVQVATAAGKSYRVEANNAFPNGSWSIVADSVVGTGSLVPVPDPGAVGIPNRIYRVTVQ